MIKRNLSERLDQELHQSRAVALLGARQVGKSTLAEDLAIKGEMDFITFDNQGSLSAAQDDPIGFISRIDRPCVIDEVQRAPEIMLSIKERLDHDNKRGQFLLTGSADLLTLKTISDTLPGRVVYLELHPFSQGEINGVKETFISGLFSNKPPVVKGAEVGHQAYAEIIVRGGYPEAQMRPPESIPVFFTSYIKSLLEREIADVSEVRDPRSLMDVFRLAAARSGSLVNYTSLARDLDISDKTVRSYLEYLQKLFVLYELRPWYLNLGHRVIKTPKIHVNDSGLLCAFTGKDIDALSGDAIDGMYLETFAVNELIKQSSWEVQPLSLYYYRDTMGKEIDVILERFDGSLVAVEIKSSATVRASDFTTLKYFSDRVGGRFKCGIVLYSGRATQSFGDRLHAVPFEGIWDRQC